MNSHSFSHTCSPNAKWKELDPWHNTLKNNYCKWFSQSRWSVKFKYILNKLCKVLVSIKGSQFTSFRIADKFRVSWRWGSLTSGVWFPLANTWALLLDTWCAENLGPLFYSAWQECLLKYTQGRARWNSRQFARLLPVLRGKSGKIQVKMQQKSVQRENIILQSHTGSEAARAREDGAIPGHHPVLLAPHFPPRCLSPTPPNFTEACLSSPSAKYSLPLCAALKPGPGALGVY